MGGGDGDEEDVMKLTDYDPRFSRIQGEDRLTYLSFRCPCAPTCEMRIHVAFTPALDGSETPAIHKPWKRSGGDTFETITLAPSIWFHGEDHPPCKGWHGFLTNGELRTC